MASINDFREHELNELKRQNHWQDAFSFEKGMQGGAGGLSYGGRDLAS